MAPADDSSAPSPVLRKLFDAQYGGEDGLNLPGHSVLPGLDLGHDVSFYYVVLALFAVLMALFGRLVDSRFGKALQGVRENESRMESLGYPVYRLKLVAFVLSGAVAGLAGALLADFEKPIMAFKDAQKGTRKKYEASIAERRKHLVASVPNVEKLHSAYADLCVQEHQARDREHDEKEELRRWARRWKGKGVSPRTPNDDSQKFSRLRDSP